MMKSQDILVLFKLITELQASESHQQAQDHKIARALPMDWQGWDVALPESTSEQLPDDLPPSLGRNNPLTIRGLEASLSLSKSEISHSLKRSIAVGLAARSRIEGHPVGQPRANAAALYEFIVHGLKYVFPAQPGIMVRGIPTGVDAPVLAGVLSRSGETCVVWPDPLGKIQGLSIAPLYRSVPHAVRQDPRLYALLALSDAIRLGRPREASVAAEQLRPLLGLA